MDFETQQFSSGLRLFAIPLSDVESATVLIMVKTGSRFETKDQNGISHFLEHMFFKGTAKRPTALDLSKTLDSIGAQYNAFTSKEYTGFYIKSAAKHLDLALDVLTDMLLNSKFDKKEIEKEKGVIIEEINMYDDLPMRRVGDVYEAMLYSDNPLGWTIDGKKEIIRKIQRADFLQYISKRYLAPNIVIGLSGKIPPITELSNHHLLKTFDQRLGGETPSDKFRKVLSSQKNPQVKVQFKKTDQAHLCIGVRTFKRTDSDRYALGGLSIILGGNMSSRLFVEVREKRGLCYYISAESEGYFDCGHFTVQAGVDIKRIDEALKITLGELGKIAEKRVPDEELGKAKEFLKGRMILELEDSKAVASHFVSQALLDESIKTPKELIKIIDRLEVADIQRVAQRIFKNSGLNFAVIGPFGNEEEFNKIIKF